MKEENHRISKIVHVFKLVADDVAAIFPYFFAFYLVSLAVSVFFTAWRGYFNWPAFHLSVLFFALISMGSNTVRMFWREVVEILKKEEDLGFEVIGLGAASGSKKTNTILRGAVEVSRRGKERVGTIAGRVGVFFRKVFVVVVYAAVVPARKKILLWKRNLGKAGYVKLAAILLVLAFSLFQGIYALDFFVLLFGLVSVLFGLDVRMSAGCALALLVMCPLLLAFSQNVFAETAAVYAYYFLVIAVFTGIWELSRHKVESYKVIK
jgi:hypothetical protein